MRMQANQLARVLITGALFLGLAAPTRARAALRLDTGAGLALPDRALADYRWDTAVQPVLALGLETESRDWSLGLAASRTAGSQDTGLIAGPGALDLALSGLGLRLGRRLARPAGVDLWLRGELGRLRLSYSPSTLQLDFGDGAPLAVDFDSVSEWYGGAGLELRRSIGAAFALGIDLGLRFFALDSARRLDGDLVHARERFHELRLGLRLHCYPGRLSAADNVLCEEESA